VIRTHPLIGQRAVEAGRKRSAVSRIQAEHRDEDTQRKKSRVTVVLMGVAAVALVGGLGTYVKQRQAAAEQDLASRPEAERADVAIKNWQPDQKPRARRRGGRTAGQAPGQVAGQDEFSEVTNLGDVSEGGGDETLSEDKIQAVMMRHYRELVPCVRGGAGIQEINIEFIVLGTGRVSAVRVNSQRTGSLHGCVQQKMQSFAFPPYNGKKTVASWSLSLR
jgi:hypothetical protein